MLGKNDWSVEVKPAILNRFLSLSILVFFSALCISYSPIMFGKAYGSDDFKKLHIDKNTDFNSLIQHWKSKSNLTPEEHQIIIDRLKAIQITQAKYRSMF